MSLVSYGYDSDSEGNSEEEDDKNVVILVKDAAYPVQLEPKENTNAQENTIEEKIQNNVKNTSGNSMFSYLPKSEPQSSGVVNDNVEDEIEDFIPKASKIEKKKEKVKITIPSLSDFKDDDSDNDEPVHKKAKPSNRGSGLLAMLPPVKSEPLSTKSFIPQSVTQKNKVDQKPIKSKPLIPDSVKRKQMNDEASSKKAKLSSKDPLESDDEDDIEIPETFDEEIWQKVCGRQQKKSVHREEIPTEQPDEINIAPEPVKPYQGLDNTAFKELVGRKRKEQNINIIDIHESEILPEKDVWMTKAITDPDCAPKPIVENPVDPTRRRKHHITYLAEQAKANEQELQNQWSANKFSRNQTRAKYGF